MGKQLFIPRVMDTNGGNLVDLGHGEIAIVAAGATTVSTDEATLSAFTADTKMQIVWSHYNSSSIESSPLFCVRDIISIKNIATSSGTKQVTDVVIALPTTQMIGDSYRITIVDTTPGTANLDKWNFEYIDTTGTKTLTQVVDGLVALINATTSTCNAVASNVSNTTVRLTGDTFYNHFRVACECEGTMTISYGTKLVTPTGLYAQMQAFELAMRTEGSGITNLTKFPVKTFVSDLESNTYNVLQIELLLRNPSKDGMSAFNVESHTLYIAEVTGSLGFSDIFTPFYGNFSAIEIDEVLASHTH